MTKRPRNNGFDIPSGYFDSLEDRLELRLMEEELPDSPGFAVPSGYFDTIADRTIAQSHRERGMVRRLSTRAIPWFAAAAAVALLLFLTIPGRDQGTTSLADLNPEAILSYIDQGGIGIDTGDIIAGMDAAMIDTLADDPGLFKDEILEQYLLQELDYSQLIVE